MSNLDDNNGKVNIHINGSVKNAQIIGAGGNINISNQQPFFNYKDLSDAFEEIYKKIEDRPTDPSIDSSEIQSTVKMIEQETTNGEKADENKMQGWLKFLADMTPDIFDVVTATLGNPIKGIGEAVKKIAVRIRRDYGY